MGRGGERGGSGERRGCRVARRGARREGSASRRIRGGGTREDARVRTEDDLQRALRRAGDGTVGVLVGGTHRARRVEFVAARARCCRSRGPANFESGASEFKRSRDARPTLSWRTRERPRRPVLRGCPRRARADAFRAAHAHDGAAPVPRETGEPALRGARAQHPPPGPVLLRARPRRHRARVRRARTPAYGLGRRGVRGLPAVHGGACDREHHESH